MRGLIYCVRDLECICSICTHSGVCPLCCPTLLPYLTHQTNNVAVRCVQSRKMGLFNLNMLFFSRDFCPRSIGVNPRAHGPIPFVTRRARASPSCQYIASVSSPSADRQLQFCFDEKRTFHVGGDVNPRPLLTDNLHQCHVQPS